MQYLLYWCGLIAWCSITRTIFVLSCCFCLFKFCFFFSFQNLRPELEKLKEEMQNVSTYFFYLYLSINLLSVYYNALLTWCSLWIQISCRRTQGKWKLYSTSMHSSIFRMVSVVPKMICQKQKERDWYPEIRC